MTRAQSAALAFACALAVLPLPTAVHASDREPSRSSCASVESGTWEFTVREVRENTCSDYPVAVGETWVAEFIVGRDGRLVVDFGEGFRLEGHWWDGRFSVSRTEVLPDAACGDCVSGTDVEEIVGRLTHPGEGRFVLTRTLDLPGRCDDCGVVVLGDLSLVRHR